MDWMAERNWRETESMEDAARRLIGVMDERAKRRKAAGSLGVEPAPQIADPAMKLEKRPAGESELGLGALNHRPSQFTPQPGEASGDHVTEGENGNGLEKRGQVVVSRKCWPAEGNTGRSIAGPHHDADTVDSLFSVPVLNGNAHRSGGE